MTHAGNDKIGMTMTSSSADDGNRDTLSAAPPNSTSRKITFSEPQQKQAPLSTKTPDPQKDAAKHVEMVTNNVKLLKS